MLQISNNSPFLLLPNQKFRMPVVPGLTAVSSNNQTQQLVILQHNTKQLHVEISKPNYTPILNQYATTIEMPKVPDA